MSAEAVVIATRPDGHLVALRVHVPPTAEDLDRWAHLARMPGLADATWTPRSGRDVR